MTNEQITPTTAPRQPTLLIIDESHSVSRALCSWLSTALPACRLLTAATAQGGMAVARAEQPDVILIDMHLPDASGIEATRNIKHALPATDVLLLSHDDADIYREKALEAGASAHTPKHRIVRDLLPMLQPLLAFPPTEPTHNTPHTTTPVDSRETCQ